MNYQAMLLVMLPCLCQVAFASAIWMKEVPQGKKCVGGIIF